MDDKTFSLFYKERINRIIDRLKDACEDRAFGLKLSEAA